MSLPMGQGTNRAKGICPLEPSPRFRTTFWHVKIPFSKRSSLLSRLTWSLLWVPFPDLWTMPLKRPTWGQGVSLIDSVDRAWTSRLYFYPGNCKCQTRACPLLLTPPALEENVVVKGSFISSCTSPHTSSTSPPSSSSAEGGEEH